MDLFLATCQGIGLALASGAIAGALAGALGARGSAAPGTVLIVLGAIAGAFLLGEFLTHEDHPAWPGWPLGALIALLGAYVAREIVAGASDRTENGGSAGTLAVYVILAAAVVAGLSLVLPPVGPLALLMVAWLAISRRRRAARKHEGLRVLR